MNWFNNTVPGLEYTGKDCKFLQNKSALPSITEKLFTQCESIVRSSNPSIWFECYLNSLMLWFQRVWMHYAPAVTQFCLQYPNAFISHRELSVLPAHTPTNMFVHNLSNLYWSFNSQLQTSDGKVKEGSCGSITEVLGLSMSVAGWKDTLGLGENDFCNTSENTLQLACKSQYSLARLRLG